MTKRKPKRRSLPDAERGTVQLNTRVPRAVRALYEAEAARRGLSLGSLVRERLEGAEWVKRE